MQTLSEMDGAVYTGQGAMHQNRCVPHIDVGFRVTQWTPR